MGQLVFQATLGGQVNLVGPNTASTYNINVPAVAGNMVTTGDSGTVTSTMLASSLSLTTPNINVATGTSLKVTSGFYSTSSSSFTYTDGIVMDYTTGLGRISVGTSDGLAFYNAGVATTELMRLDASGNLGLGVIPSAWTGYTGFDLKTLTINSGTTNGEFGFNYYYGSGYKYKGNGYAGQIAFATGTGGIAFNIAGNNVSGSGAGLSFTQAMTLDASGNLGIGTTTPGSGNRLNVKGGNGSTTLIIDNDGSRFNGATLRVGGSDIGTLYCDTSGQLMSLQSISTGYSLVFGTNQTERARIDSSGNLLVGTTSGSFKLTVNGTVSASGSVSFTQSYNDTTASAANMNIQGDGYLRRSTSALKYKQDIRDVEDFDISQLRPVRYKSKCETDDQTIDHLGLIADEAAEAGFEELVTRSADGEVEGFQYERLTVVLLKKLQVLETEVKALKGQA